MSKNVPTHFMYGAYCADQGPQIPAGRSPADGGLVTVPNDYTTSWEIAAATPFTIRCRHTLLEVLPSLLFKSKLADL